jgi:hypothetical protein
VVGVLLHQPREAQAALLPVEVLGQGEQVAAGDLARGGGRALAKAGNQVAVILEGAQEGAGEVFVLRQRAQVLGLVGVAVAHRPAAQRVHQLRP